MSFSLEAPTLVPKSFPSLNKRIVGTPLTEYLVGSLAVSYTHLRAHETV